MTQPWNGGLGTETEERVGGKLSYLDILRRLHSSLCPVHYLEIGVRHGRSLALAPGRATGIDPTPEIQYELSTTTTVISATSDGFFAGAPADVSPDFCFIDGMHLFEFVLRDFMNIEKYAAAGSVVVIDDIFPNHPLQASRQRRTRAWTGDVWRIVDVLRTHRPDLFAMSLDAAPAGLLLVAGLDPSNRVLWRHYERIVSDAAVIAQPPVHVLERHHAMDPTGAQFSKLIETLQMTRKSEMSPQETVAHLRGVQHETGGSPA